MNFSIFLASLSPRRCELLKQVGIDHAVVRVQIDERRLPRETPEDYVVRLALEKARAGRLALPAGERRPVLAADTAVVVNGEILGKPCHHEDALRMIEQLSGQTHRVYTGVALVEAREFTRLSVSEVSFRRIGRAEAQAYWRTGEPADKAGGYAIQGVGAVFVSQIQGSYSGVMGLPLFETAELLKECGIHVLAERHR